MKRSNNRGKGKAPLGRIKQIQCIPGCHAYGDVNEATLRLDILLQIF